MDGTARGFRRCLAAVASCAIAGAIGGPAQATAVTDVQAIVAPGASQQVRPAVNTLTERVDSLGREFWLAFPQNYDRNYDAPGDSPELALHINAPKATSGTISIPGLPWSQDFTVTPGVVTTVELPDATELDDGADGAPRERGVHVTAADEVGVVGTSHLRYTSDAFLGLPVDALGTDHLIMGWGSMDDAPWLSSEFSVVATQDDTEVTYTPTADTRSGVLAGTAKSTTLDAGQVLPVAAMDGDLTGTAVTATKPVSVSSGHMCAFVPDPKTWACDYLNEQIPPTSAWGQEFLTVPLKTRLKGDTFQMLAAQDNTTIRIDGTAVATLDRGQSHQQIIEGSSTISADRPILVAQLANGIMYDMVNGDPFLMLIPPTGQFLDAYTFNTPTTAFTEHYVNVVAPDTALDRVLLDGVPIPAGEFSPVKASGYSGASLDLPVGSHTITADEPIGIYVYGFNNADSYGYPGGAAFAPYNSVAGITVTPATQKALVDNEVCVRTTVVDQDGEPLLGVPVDLTITGPNPATAQRVTDADGSFGYCYTGTKRGTDDVRAAYGPTSGTAKVHWVRRELPISAHNVKRHHARLATGDHIVLVQRIHTNKHGKVGVRAYCRPAGTDTNGELNACQVKVTHRGKVIVHPGSYPTVRVGLRAKASPRHGDAQDWAPSTWSDSWQVTS